MSKSYWNRTSAKAFLCGFAVATICASIAAVLAFSRYDRQAPETACRRSGANVYKGPWGSIDALRMPLMNPGGTLPDESERMQEPEWFFEDFSERQVRRLLAAYHLTPKQRATLLDPSRWSVRSNGCAVIPPISLIWNLEPGLRARMYSLLARCPENYPQRHPFRFPTNAFDQCLEAAGLSDLNIGRLKQLTYPEPDGLCFADLPVARQLVGPREFQRLVETLYELPTYRLRLRITSESDVDALVSYWGRGGRTNLIRPVLKAMAYVPHGASLNISYLLPPFARLRLYTYPEWSKDASAPKQDCFFTALNFFNEAPDTNFFDRAHTDHVLATDYSPVLDAPAFGDLVLLLDDSGRAIHAATYIAGEFVYTKNGVNASAPWVLMKMSDMLLTYYGSGQQPRMVSLRRNNLG